MNRSIIAASVAVASTGIFLVTGTAAIAAPSYMSGMVHVEVGAGSPHDRLIGDLIVRSGKNSGVVTAAGGWSRCPGGYTCLYDGANGEGEMAYFKWGSPDLAAQGFTDRASSGWVRMKHPWLFYDLPNYQNSVAFWSEGGANFVGFSNNRISSLRAD